MRPVYIGFKKLDSSAKIPKKATPGSGCWDLYAVREVIIEPHMTEAVPTGLALEVPDGHILEIRPRSSVSMRGLIIPNSPGTVDPDFRGEVMVLLHNLTSKRAVISKGDRIAQAVLVQTKEALFREREELSKTARGEKGFGSTGR